eukprot:sb/3466577/
MWLRGYSRLKKVGLGNKSVLFLLARTCKEASRHPDYNHARYSRSMLASPYSHFFQEHARTMCRQADVLVVGAGKAGLVIGDMVKPGAVVIDCGINVLDTGKLVGDVDFEEVKKVAGFLTPVPGGVGPMTVAMLMENTVESAASLQTSDWNLTNLPLNRLTPVPSDSAIALAQPPKNIRDLAKEIGIAEQDLELHGDYKAKIKLSILANNGTETKQGNYVLVCGSLLYIAPSLKGVGPMTVAMLMENTVESAASLQTSDWNLTNLPLNRLTPVPSDSAIALAQPPKNIRDLAKEIGIAEQDLELHGDYKAKIKLSILANNGTETKQGNYVLVCG